MDIPVPSESLPDNDTEKIPVSVSTTKQKPAEQPVAADPQRADQKTPNVSLEDQQRAKIAELISTKKYHLGIKEKRSSPLLTVGFAGKKSKKTKKKSPKKADRKVQRPQTKNKQRIQIAALVALLLGFIVSIDAGLIDIGVNLPFDLIKS
jgi:thiol:disulfide interchange protein